MTVEVRVKRLPGALDLPLPAYRSEGAAGFDLAAAIPEGSVLVIEPRACELTPTGFAFEIPHGFEGQIRPRSGLALRHGVSVLNAPGTIDSDYRGEVCVLLINLGARPFEIVRGQRIAQMVVAPVAQARIVEADALEATLRGAGGFGSTGIDDVAGRAR